MKQVLIIGSTGFIGASLSNFLSSHGCTVTRVGRNEFNKRINYNLGFSDLTNSETSIVFCAARVPVRSLSDFTENTILVDKFIESFKALEFDYLLNFSSDAIYEDSSSPISERTTTSPGGLHGLMHMMRELALNETFDGKVGHVRPTLIYGPGDTHNGYGPNRFMRQAISKGTIEIFGQGEEVRDHVLIDDVCEIAWHMLASKHRSAINAVSGQPISFHNIAKIVQSLVPDSKLCYIKRTVDRLPHGGYRVFDIKSTQFNFPMVSLHSPTVGLKLMFTRLHNNV